MNQVRLALTLVVLMNAGISFSQSQHDWPLSSPEKEGMNASVLANGIKSMRDDSTNIHSLLIIKNNKLVLDAAFYPFENRYVHDLASVTKSITALLVGIAIDKKFIKSDNEPVYKFFPEQRVTNDSLKAVTIRDLLNMAAGFRCSWNDGEKELQQMRNSKDWVQYMFNLPFDKWPGKAFSYCSGNYYLLAEILQRTTRLTCHDFGKKYLFQPMDFGHSYWVSDNKNVNNGWGDLHLSIYDLAKIGSMIFYKGSWKGKQIISKQWIEKLNPIHTIQKTESYGYGWWFDRENPDEIQAVGRGGQRLFIFRNRNMIIATVGGGFEAGDLDNLALSSIEAYNKNGTNAGLNEQLKRAGSPGTPNTNSDQVIVPTGALNKRFQLDSNRLGLRSIQLDQRTADLYLVLEFMNGKKEEHPIGLGNSYKISSEKTFGLPTAVKGRSLNETALEIIYNRLTRIEKFRFLILFKSGTIQFGITEPTNGINETVIGRAL